MRQLAMKITYGPRWLAWQLYSQIIRRFALRPRDVRWYVALAVVAIIGAYAGRWHWAFPAVAWSFVTLIAVASQALAFAGRVLDERQQELAESYETRLEEMSQELQNAESAGGVGRELTDAEREYIWALHKDNARMIGEMWLQELREYPDIAKLLTDGSKQRRRGKPRGSSWYPPEEKVDISRRYLGLRHARKVPKRAGGQRAGAYYETIENWQEYKDALPEFEQRYGPL